MPKTTAPTTTNNCRSRTKGPLSRHAFPDKTWFWGCVEGWSTWAANQSKCQWKLSMCLAVNPKTNVHVRGISFQKIKHPRCSTPVQGGSTHFAVPHWEYSYILRGRDSWWSSRNMPPVIKHGLLKKSWLRAEKILVCWNLYLNSFFTSRIFPALNLHQRGEFPAEAATSNSRPPPWWLVFAQPPPVTSASPASFKEGVRDWVLIGDTILNIII